MSMRPRVLVVEDAAPVLTMLYDALTLAGFDVQSARTAREAVGFLTTQPYAVIVADCFLPDLPPLDWLAALRGAAPATPFVVYSGSPQLHELRDHAIGFGATAVLEKPFGPAALVDAVRRALGPA